MSYDFESLFKICVDGVGLKMHELSSEQSLAISMAVGNMVAAEPHWEKPAKVETEIELIRRDIRSAIRRIEALDEYTLSLTRQSAVKNERDRLVQEVIQHGQAGDRSGMEGAVAAYLRPVPEHCWVDRAAVAALKDLEASLHRPAERAIELAPSGPGRPRNEHAYRVALVAARLFHKMTGDRPTFWNGGQTPFSKLVQELFTELGVRSDLRKPIERAMSKLADDA